MKRSFYPFFLLVAPLAVFAATPIDGIYATGFVGYTYIPNNVNTSHNNIFYSDVHYQAGYDGGGSLGYRTNPLRYEAEISYFNANIHRFSQDNIIQTQVGGYNNGILSLINFAYEAPALIQTLQPFIGIGIGYAWLNNQLNNTSTTDSSRYRIASYGFAYQGTAGIAYNLSENYSLSVSYRYLGTPNVPKLGDTFQINLANVSVTYRFDSARYN